MTGILLTTFPRPGRTGSSAERNDAPTGERTFLVRLEARVCAEVAIVAPGKREAARMALEQGPDSGELVGTPQRITARVCSVREVTNNG